MPLLRLRKQRNRAEAPQATAWSRLKSRAAARFAVTKQQNNNTETPAPTSTATPQGKGLLHRVLSCFGKAESRAPPDAPTSETQPESPENYGHKGIKPKKFRTEKHLGTGGQGGVYVARYPKKQRVPGAPKNFALKIADLGGEHPSNRELAFREYKLHKMVSGHRHIATMYTGFSSNWRTPRSYLLTELLHGGDLHDLCKEWSAGLPQKVALEIAEQICQALVHMHHRGVAHCDIKPANVLLAHEFNATGSNVVKVVDFGFALKFTRPSDGSAPTKTRIPGGTSCFMSPEALENKPLDPTQLDVYSLGILMCLLLGGKSPFAVPNEDANNPQAHLRARTEFNTRRDFVEAQEWNDVAPRLKSFIGLMLSSNPAYRPSALSVLWFLSTFHVVDNG